MLMPVIRYRRPADRRGRAQRWCDAISELVALQPEYVAWLDALPDSLRATPTGEALQAIADLDLDALADIDPPVAMAATDSKETPKKPLDKESPIQGPSMRKRTLAYWALS